MSTKDEKNTNGVNAKLCSFKSVFNEEFPVNRKNWKGEDERIQAKIDKIIIPIIQRDYAQGRENEEKRRNAFLDRLRKAVDEKEPSPITLDFVYGKIKADDEMKECVMEPLDGQQRLTTLFLLHWYAAKKDKIECQEFMSKFTYRTRYSAESFCKELV